MREILFRGQDAVTKEWIYGFYVDNRDRHPPIIVPKNGNPYIYVIPETVGQYTGLKDKNGAMIFEGDILRDGKGEDGVVTYIDSIACFMAVRDGKEAWDLNEGDATRPNKLQYTEIIGNIHEEEKK